MGRGNGSGELLLPLIVLIVVTMMVPQLSLTLSFHPDRLDHRPIEGQNDVLGHTDDWLSATRAHAKLFPKHHIELGRPEARY